MDEWLNVYQTILASVERFERGPWLFRGQQDAEWKLLPGIAPSRCRDTRDCERTFTDSIQREHAVWGVFGSRAGSLIPRDASGWAVAFEMQHHGLPTRLLDWTTTMATALFFAMKDAEETAALWILNPFELNRLTTGSDLLLDPEGLDGDYEDYFIKRSKTLQAPVVALMPARHNPRIFNQRGGFTLHSDLDRPLEEIAPSAVRKINIPRVAHSGALAFLEAAGISEFSLFTDLDSLARELRAEFF